MSTLPLVASVTQCSLGHVIISFICCQHELRVFIKKDRCARDTRVLASSRGSWEKKFLFFARALASCLRFSVEIRDLKGKVRYRKSFSKLRKLFPRNSKIIAVLSSSLSKCDKSTLKLPLS